MKAHCLRISRIRRKKERSHGTAEYRLPHPGIYLFMKAPYQNKYILVFSVVVSLFEYTLYLKVLCMLIGSGFLQNFWECDI